MSQTRVEYSNPPPRALAPRSRPTDATGNAGSSRHRRQDGYTLLHVLFVMILMAMLLAMSTSTLFTLIQAERNVRQQRFYDSTMWRLSRQLRDDVHMAHAADLDQTGEGSAGTDRLILHLGENRRIQYQIETDRILRTARQGQAKQHHESYETPSRTAARWEMQQISGHRVVCLLLPRKLDGAATGPSIAKTLRIAAVVGYDQRFLTSSAENQK